MAIGGVGGASKVICHVLFLLHERAASPTRRDREGPQRTVEVGQAQTLEIPQTFGPYPLKSLLLASFPTPLPWTYFVWMECNE